MKILFVANLELDKNEGIYKKVYAQAEALALNFGSCLLLTKSGLNAVENFIGQNKKNISDIAFFDYILDYIKNNKVDALYVRLMVPSFNLIRILKFAKSNNVRILYEIPTYPFFGEQLKAARKKYRGLIKIFLNIVFFPFINHYVDRIIVIRSNSKIKLFKKMYEITNGVNVNMIKSKKQLLSDHVFRMVTVGTLYSYHGYDRILKGLNACNEKIGECIVEFHIIGKSQTINDLKKQVSSLGLQHVFFHGLKNSKELNDLFDNFHVGLGCLALHRRNADIDTTLKVIEYFCRGIPVISSGETPFSDKNFVMKVPNNDDAISIELIYRFYKSLSLDSLNSLSSVAKDTFSWNKIMKQCFNEII